MVYTENSYWDDLVSLFLETPILYMIWSYDLPVEDGLSARMHCAYLAPKSAEPFRGDHIAHA